MAVLLVCFLSSLAVKTILAFPDGAPVAACGDMIPQHGVPPQNTTNPYKLTVQPAEAGKYTVTVSAPASGSYTNFKGFFIRASQNGELVGEFTTINSVTTQYRPCPSDTSPHNGITHINSNTKTSVSATWSHEGSIAGIMLSATVVNDAVTFWVGLKTDI